MARLRGHAHLNEDHVLYATRRMTVDGRIFEVGDEFPWEELPGVTPRLLRMLHEQRRVSHERPADPPGGVEPVQPPDVRDRRASVDSAPTQKAAPANNQTPSRPNGKPVVAVAR